MVCEDHRVPEGVRVERGWVALKLEGAFPFSMTGVLASFLQPLAERKIPIFAISTFDTDYVLIKREDLERSKKSLAAAGHHERLVPSMGKISEPRVPIHRVFCDEREP